MTCFSDHCSAFVAIVCSLLLGFGDSCYNTQIYSIVGGIFPEDSAPAFAIFKFTQVCRYLLNTVCAVQLSKWQLTLFDSYFSSKSITVDFSSREGNFLCSEKENSEWDLRFPL
jgi:hypothetical protein